MESWPEGKSIKWVYYDFNGGEYYREQLDRYWITNK